MVRACYFLVVMTEARSAVLVRLSPKLKARLSEMAKRERRSLSRQVEFLLERCVGLEEPGFEIEKLGSSQPQAQPKRKPFKP